MKKYLLLILLLIPVCGISQSLLDSIQIKIQEKIQHLNHANIPSNILYERTFQKANLVAFSSEMEGNEQQSYTSGDSIPISSNFHFFMALDDLNRSDYLNRYNNNESLYLLNKNSSVSNKNSVNSVNIGIINTDFAVFNEDPLASGALYVTGTDSLLYENSNSLYGTS